MTDSNEQLDQFELESAPAEYAPIDEAAEGRWFTLSVSGKSVGTIWTDDADAFGFKPDRSSSAKSDEFSRINDQISRYRSMDVPASVVYEAMKQFTNHTSSDEQSGSLEAVVTAPVTAAVNPKEESAPDRAWKPGDAIPADDLGLDPSELEEYNFVAVDENNEVVGVGRSTEAAMLLRDNGNWVPLPDDDLRFDGCEWLEIDDSILESYDKRIQEGLEFTREDVDDPIA